MKSKALVFVSLLLLTLTMPVIGQDTPIDLNYAPVENDDGTTTYFALIPEQSPFSSATLIPSSSAVFTERLELDTNAEPEDIILRLTDQQLDNVVINAFESFSLGASTSGDARQLFASGALRTGDTFIFTAQVTDDPQATETFVALVISVIENSGFPYGIPEDETTVLESDAELAIPDDCSAFTLANDTAEPMQAVEMTGFPIQLIQNRAVFISDDGTETPALMVQEPDGRKMLQVPPYPQAPFTGGSLTFRVLDDTGTTVCADRPVTVAPLAEAPGAFAEYVSVLGDVLAAQRDVYGLTEEQLLSGELDNPALFNLAAAQFFYNSPNNPNALVHIVDGTAPILDDPTYDARLVDAVIAQAGLTENADSIATAFWGFRAPGLAAPMPQETALRRLGEKRVINTAEELVAAFEDQAEAYDDVGGFRADQFNNKALAATVIGVFNPVVGTVIAAGIFVTKTPKDADMLLLPSKFDEVEFSLDGQRVNRVAYDEDDAAMHTFSRVVVEVSSEEWVLNTVINDARLVAVGAAGIAGNVATTTRGLEAAAGVMDDAALAADISNNVCGRNVDACIGQEKQIVLGPYSWRVSLEDDSDYWEVEYREPLPNPRSPVVRPVSGQPKLFELENAGFAQARIRTTDDLNPRRVGLAAAFITVEEIVVSHSPASQRVEELEQACITTVVLNAEDTGVAWTVTESYAPTFPIPETAAETPSQTCVNAPTIDEDTIEYTDPLLCSLDPVVIPKFIVVQGEATAFNGPRDPNLNPPPRTETATIGVVPDEEKLERNPPPPRPECEEEEPTEEPPLNPGTLESIRPGLYAFTTFNGCSGVVEQTGEVRIETYQDFSAYFDFMSVGNITDEGGGVFDVQLDPGILLIYTLWGDGDIDLTSMVGAMPGLVPACDNIVDQSFEYIGP